MTLPDIISALRTDPDLARALYGALLARECRARGGGNAHLADVNVAMWTLTRGEWECSSVGGFRLAAIETKDGSYWHERMPWAPAWPRATVEQAKRICTEALQAAGWVVHE